MVICCNWAGDGVALENSEARDRTERSIFVNPFESLSQSSFGFNVYGFKNSPPLRTAFMEVMKALIQQYSFRARH